ncbi:hypothetical protein K2173_004826 [Erythroxylum novogranatense]|uniref:peptidylprolyl isomerase n=1 Tax=Erythroxylum novogranatense TaxID=1862640 RepID=A0AAV8SKQ5_9ROSI|nr:hypothetical protein K2173_004826 [Erythroxylum novogranatense]
MDLTTSASVHFCHFPRPSWFSDRYEVSRCVGNFSGVKPLLCNNRLSFSSRRFAPISAVGSGLEASIADLKDSVITLKNAKFVEETREKDQIQLRVDLTGDDTQKVFSKVLRDLARSAPPIPGFRREKGGKTTKVPQEFLLQILGEDRVTNFVIQEIVSSTLADYAKRENLKVKDNKVNTIQKAEELKRSFTPGSEFGFNAVLELEETGTEQTSS